MLVYTLLKILLYCCALGSEGQLITSSSAPIEVKLSHQGALKGDLKFVTGKAIYYFWGVPYAEPPIGYLRFKPPKIHPGWEGIYSARSFKPPCPQPTGSPSVRSTMSEDCLYLNVWTPFLPSITSSRLRPVIIIIEGQLFTLGNPQDVPADDFVSDQDVVVVSVAYRLNAFGFLTYEDPNLPGNLGLRDQSLAIKWVYENIEAFGGDPNQIVLLGHSAGAASVGFHLISMNTRSYIERAIIMSGSILAPWASQRNPKENAIILARSLVCPVTSSEEMLTCLQAKTMIEIVTAVDEMIAYGNISAIFSPIIDESFLFTENTNFLSEAPLDALKRGNFKKVPILTGVMNEEGILMGYFIKDQINQLKASEIQDYLEKTILSELVRQMPSISSDSAIRKVISHEYMKTQAQSADQRLQLINDVVDLFSDAYFVAPLLKQLDLMSLVGNEIYFYVNSFTTLDIYGNSLLNRTSSAHGSDLTYLFGPTMYKAFFATDFPSFSEGRLAKNMKSIFGDFCLYGAPVSLTNIGVWTLYNRAAKNYYEINSGASSANYNNGRASRFWTEYLPYINNKLSGANSELSTSNNNSFFFNQVPSSSSQCSSYEIATWLLLFTCIILIIAFLIAFGFFARQTRRNLKMSSRNPSVFSVGSTNPQFQQSPQIAYRRPPPQHQGLPTRNNSSQWRESLTDFGS